MSDKRKLDFIRFAKRKGYKIYLYFIATVDPIINIERVKLRVEQGGHSVPEDKIVSRYHRAMQNLYEAIMLSDRAFIFDNSSEAHIWIAESDKKTITIKNDIIPIWFKEHVIDKLPE